MFQLKAETCPRAPHMQAGCYHFIPRRTFMRIRRSFPIALAVVVVAAAIVFAVQLRKHAPPEPARLLPGADAFLYADFSWIRKVSSRPLPAVSHDPDYEKFIQETGFQFERDLDTVAFAVHYPTAGATKSSPATRSEPRFSEVFVGKFDGTRLAAYLKKIANSIENYNSLDIFTIPIEGRPFRVAILSVDAVAASNHDDPAVIRGIVDRSRRLASPFGGPAFLRRYFKRVQLASPVWMVARVDPSSTREFGGWSDFLTKPADLVISASYNPLHLPLRTDALHLRGEAWAEDEEDARNLAEKLNVFLSMFHAAETSVGSGTDTDIKALFDSVKVRQEDKRAVVYATVPIGVFRKLLENPPLPPEVPVGAASKSR